jgi:hypothetical protein
MKNIKLKFIAYGYQHCVNDDGDWDGYEISRIIEAETPAEANQKIFNGSHSMHTEIDEVTEFLCPINKKKYPLSMLVKISPIIDKWMKKQIAKQKIEEIKKEAKKRLLKSLENAKETTRQTFLDREMPYLVA